VSRGDHLYVSRGRRYTHHAVDCGDGTVIHYTGGRRSGRRVERTSFEEFSLGSEVFVRPYRHRLPVDEIVANAESRIGSHGYHLVRNNCEHLATWASTGTPASTQVRRWVMAAPGAVASISAAEAAGLHLMVLSSLGIGAYAVGSPLRRTLGRSRRYTHADR
jgi:hypothetical protein